MKQKRKFIDYFDTVFKKNKNDDLIVYKKSSFYPCIQIEVITIEKSREDMGILEMTILKLIKLGISDIVQIAKLTGFNKPDKLNALIDEMIGYGMIELKNSKLFISEIGKESIACGHQMIATRTSLLLCGITGKLLPKAMYGAKRVEADELSSCIGFKYLIDEKPTISLESLDLKGIDKRKYNIKDEVDYISEYLDYTQVFLEADITVFKDIYKKFNVEIMINKSIVDWQFNFDNLLIEIKNDVETVDNVKIFLQNYYNHYMFDNITIKTLDMNAIELEFDNIDKSLLKENIMNHPFLAYIGLLDKEYYDPCINPLPLSVLPFPQKKHPNHKKLYSKLQGQAIYFTTKSEETLKLVKIYRQVYELKYNYYQISYNERKSSLCEYIKENIIYLNVSKEEVNKIIDLLPKKIQTCFVEGDDE